MLRHRIAILAWLPILGWAATTAAAGDVPEDLLDRPIPRFAETDIDMTQFAYRLQRDTGVPVGMIMVTNPRADNGDRIRPVAKVTIDRTNVTARELLDEAIRQAPAYLWRPSRNGVVNILPVAEVNDPESFINRTYPSFIAKDEELSFVLKRVGRSMRTEDHPFVRASTPARTEAELETPRGLSFTVENGTGLDVLNAAFREEGPDVFWRLDFDVLQGLRVELSRVKLIELDEAEAYLLQPDKTRDEAVRLFEKAKTAAPFDALAAFIDFRIAEVLASGDLDGVPDWNRAFDQYMRVIKAAQPRLHCYPEVLEGLFAAAAETGRTQEAVDVLAVWEDDTKRPPALGREELGKHVPETPRTNNVMGWAILGAVVFFGVMAGVLAASLRQRNKQVRVPR